MEGRESRKGERYAYIALLNVICAISVVLLHTNVCFWQYTGTQKHWFSANIVQCVFYFGVPCFFMLTGATLMDYRERYSTKVYLQKRFHKTVVPFLFWSAFAVANALLIALVKHKEFEIRGGVALFNAILNAEQISSFWFFTALFSAYLSICVLSAIPAANRKRLFSGIAIAWFGMNSLLPFLNDVLHIGLHIPTYLAIGSDYLFYCIVGYLLHHYEISRRGARIAIYLLGLLGLAVHAAGTYVLSVSAGSVISLYKGYTNVPCILHSVAMFVFVQQLAKRLRSAAFWKAVYFLKDYTFALYLLHYFILKDLFRGILGMRVWSMAYRFGTPVPVLALTIGITWIVRKIPVLRRVLPK